MIILVNLVILLNPVNPVNLMILVILNYDDLSPKLGPLGQKKATLGQNRGNAKVDFSQIYRL